MLHVFREEEVRSLVDLNETGFAPSLYCFKLEGDAINIFMEKIENGVTLRDVIDTHMSYIWTADPSLARRFSLYIFQELLSAVHTMHQIGWVHRDLHPGNIMLQYSDGIIKTRITDFGNAIPICSERGLEGFRSDIAEVVRKFTALYIGQEFCSKEDTRTNWQKGVKEYGNVIKNEPPKPVNLNDLNAEQFIGESVKTNQSSMDVADSGDYHKLQKTQMENAKMLFQQINRPHSSNELRQSSVTPTDSRSDESTQKLSDVQNELISQRKKNALLEKQIGKSKIEQNKNKDGLPTCSKKNTGRASSVNVSAGITGRDSMVFGDMDEGDPPQNMNLEELGDMDEDDPPQNMNL